MSRKGIAKEDGQEDNGEMDHVHRAVIDGLHHNVQSRVRLAKPWLNKKTSRSEIGIPNLDVLVPPLG